jgi:hypothetical protein
MCGSSFGQPPSLLQISFAVGYTLWVSPLAKGLAFPSLFSHSRNRTLSVRTSSVWDKPQRQSGQLSGFLDATLPEIVMSAPGALSRPLLPLIPAPIPQLHHSLGHTINPVGYTSACIGYTSACSHLTSSKRGRSWTPAHAPGKTPPSTLALLISCNKLQSCNNPPPSAAR